MKNTLVIRVTECSKEQHSEYRNQFINMDSWLNYTGFVRILQRAGAGAALPESFKHLRLFFIACRRMSAKQMLCDDAFAFPIIDNQLKEAKHVLDIDRVPGHLHLSLGTRFVMYERIPFKCIVELYRSAV